MASITYNGKEEPSLFGVIWKKLQDLAKKVVLKADLVTAYPEDPEDPDEPFTDEQAMSAKFIHDRYQTKENLVTALQIVPDDTHYPSEKLVADTFQKKQYLAIVINYLTNSDSYYPSVKLVNDTFQRKGLVTKDRALDGIAYDDTHFLSEKFVMEHFKPYMLDSTVSSTAITLSMQAAALWEMVAIDKRPVHILLVNSTTVVHYPIIAWGRDMLNNTYSFVTALGDFTASSDTAYPSHAV